MQGFWRDRVDLPGYVSTSVDDERHRRNRGQRQAEAITRWASCVRVTQRRHAHNGQVAQLIASQLEIFPCATLGREGKWIAVTMSPGFSVVLPGPRKNAAKGSWRRSVHPVDLQHSIKSQAGPNGIPGGGGVADVADNRGAGPQLVAGNRTAGLRQQGIMRLHIRRGDHPVHIDRRANGQTRLRVKAQVVCAIQVFDIDQKFGLS